MAAACPLSCSAHGRTFKDYYYLGLMCTVLTTLGVGIVFGLACVPSAFAEVVKAIDGNTLMYLSTPVRLWGIDAPDRGQTCADGWPAGKEAAEHLAKLVDHQNVVCALKNTASPVPVYALCKVDGRDLSAAMANAGMAWANTSQTPDYTVNETNAMSYFAGVHGHRCMKAEEWRARHGDKSNSQ